jgi:nucleoside-diphosphate-sugar epimerase
MRVLVTGGAGFIGSNLVQELVAQGHDVVVVDDLSSGWLENLDGIGLLHFLQGDVRDRALVRQAVTGCGAVFHLAASVGNQKSIDLPVEDASVNVMGTMTVLDAAREAHVPKFVYSSSAGIFGEVQELPMRETHPTEPISPYGASKLAAEHMALTFGETFGVDVVCLRYFNVYGARQRFDPYGNVIPKFVHAALHGLPVTVFGDGEQTRDFVDVRDVVTANMLAMTFDGSEVFNIGTGHPETINGVVDTLRRIFFGELRSVSAEPRQGDVKDSWADIRRATERLGFTPQVPLEEGLADYVSWARQAMGIA